MPIDDFAKMNQIPTNRPAQAVLRGDGALRFPHDLHRMLLEGSWKEPGTEALERAMVLAIAEASQKLPSLSSAAQFFRRLY